MAEETARGVTDAHEPIDLVIVRVSTMMLGKVVFYEAQLDGANPRRVLRQRLHRFEPDADNETITHTVLALASEDNLTKGAAGQAIQAANIVLGMPETTGLPLIGLLP